MDWILTKFSAYGKALFVSRTEHSCLLPLPLQPTDFLKMLHFKIQRNDMIGGLQQEEVIGNHPTHSVGG